MISKLKSITNNSRESCIPIRLVINSFSGNSIEYSQSEQIINYFNSKKISPSEILDINQEMVFEKSKKLQGTFRNQYFKTGKIMKIDNTAVIPQVIFNETLAINYTQFILLAELNLIEKIVNNKICCHFRFFEERIVYPKIKFSKITENSSVKYQNNNIISNFLNLDVNECIYCLSNKKQLMRVKFFCNFRNSFDEETHQILDFCETNGVVLKIFDCENLNNFNKFPDFKNKDKEENMLEYYQKNSKRPEERILLIDDQAIKIGDFLSWKIPLCDGYISKNKAFEECFICSRRILDKPSTEKIKVSFNLNKCEVCMRSREDNSSNFEVRGKRPERAFGDKNIRNFKNKLSSQDKNINCYNFIEKLKIKEFFFENPEKSFFEKEERTLEFSSENFKPLTSEMSDDVENIESTNCKSMDNDFSILDF